MQSQTAPTVSAKTGLQRVRFWAARGAAGGLLVWLCVWTMQGVSALFEPVESATISEERSFPPLESLVIQAPEEGRWEFHEGGGELRGEAVATQLGREKLREIPDVQGKASPVKDQGMLELLKSRGERIEGEEFTGYSLGGGGFEAAGFVTEKSPEELVVVRWLIPIDGARSWLLEQRGGGDGSSSTKPKRTILPEGISQQLLTERLDARGECQCQLLLAETTLPDLLDQMRRNSWEIKSPYDLSGEEFVTISLTRNDDCFWMVVTPVANSRSLRILLLRDRTPAVSPAKLTPTSEGSP